jgi:DNA-binding cell septation regulator SpoVG
MSAAIEVLAIRALDGKSNVKAFVDIKLGAITNRGCKIVQQPDRKAWLAMPSIKTDRAWNNVVEIVSKDLKARITEVVLQAWSTRSPGARQAAPEQSPAAPVPPTPAARVLARPARPERAFSRPTVGALTRRPSCSPARTTRPPAQTTRSTISGRHAGRDDRVSAILKVPFGELAPFLADYGYEPVPIRPGAKAPMIDDWQAGHLPNHYLPQYASWGTGILTRSCPAVDLDVRDKELVRVLIELADDLLGPSPFRVGCPPKVLVPFRTGAPLDKISGRWWAMPGDDWRAPAYSPHRVEILGDGQQFVAYARHPRGTFYRWCRGEPMDTLQIDLPEIDVDQAQAFLETAERVIAEAGGVPLARRNKIWFPDTAQHEQDRRRSHAGERIDSDWQRLDPETLAKLIDAKHARRLKAGAWITSCPAHRSEGHRSLSITARQGGGSIVHCFGDCTFAEVDRAISTIVGRAAA